MQDVARVAEPAESEELAVAGAIAMLQVKLGWGGDSEARSEILSRFGGIAKAIFAQSRPKPEPDAAESDALAVLTEFEAWYVETHNTPFWDLFDQPMLETPLVDF
jgi:hypothetical protein